MGVTRAMLVVSHNDQPSQVVTTAVPPITSLPARRVRPHDAMARNAPDRLGFMTANDDKLGGCRLYQLPRRAIANDNPAHLATIGIAFLPTSPSVRGPSSASCCTAEIQTRKFTTSTSLLRMFRRQFKRGSARQMPPPSQAPKPANRRFPLAQGVLPDRDHRIIALWTDRDQAPGIAPGS